MTTCELCGCTKYHVKLKTTYTYGGEPDDNYRWICDPSCEPENEVSE